ncbi:MAG: phosphate signaling complex protein PhoU [Methanobacteriota archaeon]|nr:MAG: phosphate signaling complex protein PhoU [Euryarchaeota archaeon]
MPEKAERKALAEGLRALNENMVTLADLSELAIRKAVDGLTRLDPEVSEEVFTLNGEIYALQLEIEKNCVDLIALHAPVARDLRTITTSLKITTDFDRIGRYAKDIAEITLRFRGKEPDHLRNLGSIPRMTEIAIQLVDKAIRAFVARDAESVRHIQEDDDAVDLLEERAFEELVDKMKSRSLDVEVGARYILVTRYLERIADHAVNIGQRVVYMVTGDRVPRIRAVDRKNGTR